jgi:hypothetical protein
MQVLSLLLSWLLYLLRRAERCQRRAGAFTHALVCAVIGSFSLTFG